MESSMQIENIIAWSLGGFAAALLGVAASHYLTVRSDKTRAEKKRNAYLSEFSLIRDSFRIAIPKLLHDFENPQIKSHSLLPDIDFDLINLFTAELAVTDFVLTPNQRNLIKRLKHISRNIGALEMKRGDIEWGDSYTKTEGHEFRLFTAALLYKATQIQFFLIKQDREGDNFNFIGDYTLLDCAEISCKDCEMEFNEELWSQVKFFSDQVS